MFLSPKHILFDYYILFLLIFHFSSLPLGSLGGTVVKNMPANAGDTGAVLGWGRSAGVGNGNPVKYSYLENSMNRGAHWATVHGVIKSQT